MKLHRRAAPCCALTIALTAMLPLAGATNLTLKDGRTLEGRVGRISQIASDPLSPNGAAPTSVQNIMVVDDDLRRTFVSTFNLKAVNEEPPKANGRMNGIKIHQTVAIAGRRVGSVGAFLKVTPFDKFGRRAITMSTNTGPVTIIQGITEITPVWTKVEGLQTQGNPFLWDMRISTNSIPRETLHAILETNQRLSNPGDAEDYRAKIVRLFMWGGRYFEAEQELKDLLKAAKNPEDYREFSKQLSGLSTNLLLHELEQRADAGQHQFAFSMLERFAAQAPDPNRPVPGEVQQRVGEMLRAYEKEKTLGTDIIGLLDAQLALLKDDPIRYQFEPLIKQIKTDLNYNTLNRLAAFYRLHDAENLKPAQRLALAVSGWVLGSDAATEDPTIAISALQIRTLMRGYLREPSPLKRADLLKQLNSQAGFTAKLTAQIADFMKPPLDLPEKLAAPGNINGFYELSVPAAQGAAPVSYFVQLPPEYDPYRRYPTIVTLHGSNTTPEQQIEWWAGPPQGDPAKNQNRQGQATRQGYIVIAPAWSKPGQNTYEGSEAEHYAVLGCLRDACRRFAIDTDRVYLSGHSLGGNAAWDIGLSHPDLWAGVIPIVAVLDEKSFVARYTANAAKLPLYFVCGELDGDKLMRNSIHFDRYMTAPKCDATVVEYLGRGHEDFSDEIQRLFDWMGRKRRDFFPKDFACNTMRAFDNYFWYLEINEFPPNTTVDPVNDSPPPGAHALLVTGKVAVDTKGTTSNLWINAGTAKISVWLNPETVDLTHPVFINFNGKSSRAPQPRGETVLEDIRTRGDRRHPFWVKWSSFEGP
ncbi:MAG TPA: peptidase [Pirellulales bacterium]|nr:peptidase [Pirellulales bacterium]